MAKVRCNAVVRELSGGIGNLVFRQMPDGSTYVSSKQDFSRRKFSQGQKGHQARFQAATRYARRAAKSQSIYTQLAAGTGRSPYNFALADWFHAPVIHCVERRGSLIRVQASDDVMVVGVYITILDNKGGISEKGKGVRGQGDWWEYTATVTGKVIVGARDLARNVVKVESEK